MTASLAPAPDNVESALTEFAQGWWDATLPFRTLLMNALAGFCAGDLSAEDVAVLTYCLQNALRGAQRVDYPPHMTALRHELLTLIAESSETIQRTYNQRRTAVSEELGTVQRRLAAFSAALRGVGIKP
jgi:hypothetical protein